MRLRPERCLILHDEARATEAAGFHFIVYGVVSRNEVPVLEVGGLLEPVLLPLVEEFEQFAAAA